MDKFLSKNALDKKREAEKQPLDEFADFQGTTSELYFLKASRFLSRHRKQIGIGLGVAFFVLLSVVAFFEYRESQIQKDTAAFEEMEARHKKLGTASTQKIQDYESFLANHSSGTMELRLWKELSRLYAENKEWEKAALPLEKAGKKIDSPKEIKAYYFYIAGNYREQSGQEKEALENYTVSSTLLEGTTEISSFKAWSFYQTGRLRFQTGDKAGAKAILEKVLKLEPKGMDSLEEVKLLSSYILLKLGKI